MYVRLSETFEQMSLGPVVDRALDPQYGLAPLLVRQPAETLRAGTPLPLFMGFNGNEGLLFVESLMDLTPPVVTPKLYAEGVRAVFDAEAAEILGTERYAVNTPPRYGLRGQTLVAEEHGGPLTALTDMIGDLAFACGILAAGSDEAADSAPVWVYRFLEPAVTPAGPGTQLCDPGNAWQNVCHGAELPYAFDVLPDTAAGQAAGSAARVVNGAWASFARDPGGQGPGPGFARFAPDTRIVNLLADAAVRHEPGAGLARTAHCARLWDRRLPGRSAAGALVAQ
jgi:carboxylesterase type B